MLSFPDPARKDVAGRYVPAWTRRRRVVARGMVERQLIECVATALAVGQARFVRQTTTGASWRLRGWRQGRTPTRLAAAIGGPAGLGRGGRRGGRPQGGVPLRRVAACDPRHCRRPEGKCLNILLGECCVYVLIAPLTPLVRGANTQDAMAGSRAPDIAGM
jgi:hypothetical protein